ncbi:MAG: sugar phosphate isomerase/epimerase family protein [Lacibacter sp.]
MPCHTNRREFIQYAAGLLAFSLTGISLTEKVKLPLLSFSTLGCPDWSFSNILDFAVAHQFQAIELRGIQRQLDLIKCPEFNTRESIQASIKMVKDKNLKLINLGASASLHIENPAERLNNLNEAKRFIDLAGQLGCPYVRVFPNNFPKGKDRDAIIELIVKGLIELGNYTQGTNVTVLMETHGDVVRTADIKKIMELTAHKKVGLVWDIVNMWEVTKEPPAEVYKSLKKYIRHVHIKDGNTSSGKLQYTLLGKGGTPIFTAIDILRKDNYQGYYSFEWEKLWHPEIAEPEIAIADYVKVMTEHFSK